MSSSPTPLRMSIGLEVLEHLGIGLYSNNPAVLSELVANAWDADARNVSISLDTESQTVTIEDDGHGMTRAEINDRFLSVGYNRRRDHGTTPTGRRAMGRKGIGKLATFSIADTVEIHTTKQGESTAFAMATEAIRACARQRQDYLPDEIPSLAPKNPGTLIRLTNLRKKLDWTEAPLRRQLARRFSVIGEHAGFSVAINGTPITVKDRDFFNKMEFIWHFGEPAPNWDYRHAPRGDAAGTLKAQVSFEVDGEQTSAVLRGFIGTVARPRQLNGVNNAIVLSARGRLVHEDLLPEYREARLYTEYVVGEVIADFLDDDDSEDIVTSGRQRVQQGDPRYRAVKDSVGRALRQIRDEWNRKRREKGADRALQYSAIKRWYEQLGPDSKAIAKTMFGKIESLRTNDDRAKYELYRASILAFEKLKQRDLLSQLGSLDSKAHFDTLAALITGMDEVEAILYHDIVEGRLAVIRKLRDRMPNALEKTLQRHLFKHLWLLNPSWERPTSRQMEETVMAEFAAIDAKLSEEEKSGRIDIRFTTVFGKHVIVELKRYKTTVHIDELMKQLRKYREAVRKCLGRKFPGQDQEIECVAVLGKSPGPPDTPQRELQDTLRTIGARYVTYDQLVEQAEDSLRDYRKAKEGLTNLAEIFDQLGTEMQPSDDGSS